MWEELKTFEEDNHVDDVEYVDSHVLWTFKSVGEPGQSRSEEELY